MRRPALESSPVDGVATRPRIGLELIRRLRTAAAVDRWLTVVAVAMVVTALLTAIAIVVDPHHITGERGWIKPTRFAVSCTLTA